MWRWFLSPGIPKAEVPAIRALLPSIEYWVGQEILEVHLAIPRSIATLLELRVHMKPLFFPAPDSSLPLYPNL